MRWSSMPMPMRKRHIWAFMWSIHRERPGPVVFLDDEVDGWGEIGRCCCGGGWGLEEADDCGGGVVAPAKSWRSGWWLSAVTAIDGRSGIVFIVDVVLRKSEAQARNASLDIC